MKEARGLLKESFENDFSAPSCVAVAQILDAIRKELT